MSRRSAGRSRPSLQRGRDQRQEGRATSPSPTRRQQIEVLRRLKGAEVATNVADKLRSDIEESVESIVSDKLEAVHRALRELDDRVLQVEGLLPGLEGLLPSSGGLEFIPVPTEEEQHHESHNPD